MAYADLGRALTEGEGARLLQRIAEEGVDAVSDRVSDNERDALETWLRATHLDT